MIRVGMAKGNISVGYLCTANVLGKSTHGDGIDQMLPVGQVLILFSLFSILCSIILFSFIDDN